MKLELSHDATVFVLQAFGSFPTSFHRLGNQQSRSELYPVWSPIKQGTVGHDTLLDWRQKQSLI